MNNIDSKQKPSKAEFLMRNPLAVVSFSHRYDAYLAFSGLTGGFSFFILMQPLTVESDNVSADPVFVQISLAFLTLSFVLSYLMVVICLSLITTLSCVTLDSMRKRPEACRKLLKSVDHLFSVPPIMVFQVTFCLVAATVLRLVSCMAWINFVIVTPIGLLITAWGVHTMLLAKSAIRSFYVDDSLAVFVDESSTDLRISKPDR